MTCAGEEPLRASAEWLQNSHCKKKLHLLRLCSLVSNSLRPFGLQLSRLLPFPIPGDLLDPVIEPTALGPPALAGRFFTSVPLGSPCCEIANTNKNSRRIVSR